METKKLKAVFDINVYVAAYLSKNPSSPTVELLKRWRDNEFTILYSDKILREIIRKFIEKGVDAQYIIALISDLQILGEYVNVTSGDIKSVIPEDPDDDIFVACALKGNATHLVTYDPHFDCLKGKYQQFEVIDGLHFLYQVRRDKIPER